MANRESRLDNHAIDFTFLRRRVVQRLAADGEICPDDRAVIHALDDELAELHDTAARHRLTAFIEKGGDPSTYMDHLSCPIGWKVTPLDNRQRGRVVAFPHSDTAG